MKETSDHSPKDQTKTINQLPNEGHPVESSEENETRSLEAFDKGSASKEIQQISAIRGNPQAEAEVSQLRIETDKDLIKDLEKELKDHPRPAHHDKNLLKEYDEEIKSSMEKLKNDIQKEGGNKVESIYEKNPEYRTLIDTMREDGISADKQIEILSSSPEPAVKKIFKEGNENTLGPWGNNVFRHWGGESRKVSNWVTPNPERPFFGRGDLDLPPENTTEKLTTFKLKDGTRYYESKKKSGEIQYYILNPEEDLVEVKTIEDRN